VEEKRTNVVEGPDGPITNTPHERLKIEIQTPGGLSVWNQTRNPKPATDKKKWEEFITNPEAMVRHYKDESNVQVPEEIICLITTAFAGLRGWGTAKELISAALAKSFIKTDMMHVIKRQANTTNGLTGFTDQMLNFLSNLFRLMERMWQARHVPEIWKLKGLVWFSNSDTIFEAGNLRPIHPETVDINCHK
jgi:hypothetical protein